MDSNDIQWHPEAIRDAEEAGMPPEKRNPFAARGFLLALDDAVNVVMSTPDRWPSRSDGCRHYVFPSKYPYTLV